VPNTSIFKRKKFSAKKSDGILDFAHPKTIQKVPPNLFAWLIALESFSLVSFHGHLQACESAVSKKLQL